MTDEKVVVFGRFTYAEAVQTMLFADEVLDKPTRRAFGDNNVSSDEESDSDNEPVHQIPHSQQTQQTPQQQQQTPQQQQQQQQTPPSKSALIQQQLVSLLVSNPPTQPSSFEGFRIPLVPVPTDSPNSPLDAALFQALLAECTHSTLYVAPRGFVNLGNLCFMNSVLQSLLYIQPMLGLWRALAQYNLHPLGSFPLLSRFVSLFQRFHVSDDARDRFGPALGAKVSKLESRTVPIQPLMFYDTLSEFHKLRQILMRPGLSKDELPRTKQEDAQEYLLFVLDLLDEEFSRLAKALEAADSDPSATTGSGSGDTASGSTMHTADTQQPVNETGDWQEVGKKNRSAKVSVVGLASRGTPVDMLFRGTMRSTVRRQGVKNSITTQPFLTIQLDIDSPKVTSLERAIELHVSPEVLDSYVDPVTRATVVASKQMLFESLPAVLVFHIKRFSWNQGAAKIAKHISFPAVLRMHRNALSDTSPEFRIASTTDGGLGSKYTLTALIEHHGETIQRGHYTSCCRQADGSWVFFDDDKVREVDESEVLGCHAYLLFYLRDDK